MIYPRHTCHVPEQLWAAAPSTWNHQFADEKHQCLLINVLKPTSLLHLTSGNLGIWWYMENGPRMSTCTMYRVSLFNAPISWCRSQPHFFRAYWGLLQLVSPPPLASIRQFLVPDCVATGVLIGGVSSIQYPTRNKSKKNIISQNFLALYSLRTSWKEGCTLQCIIRYHRISVSLIILYSMAGTV